MVFAAVVLAAVSMNAQPRAIGARLGYGAEFSYQHSLGENMLQAELSFPGFTWGVGAAATYDWINPFGTSVPWSHKGEWNWYMGVGAAAGLAWPRIDSNDGIRHSEGGFYAGVAGRVGIEYDFWFPLQLSLDWRPVFGPSVAWDSTTTNGSRVTNYSTAYYMGGLYAGAICLGVRYKF